MARRYIRVAVSLVLISVALAAVSTAVAAHSVRARRRLEREAATLRDRARLERDGSLRTRAAFLEDLELELLRAERSGEPLSLLVATLDGSDPPAAIGGTAAADGTFVIERAAHRGLRAIDLGYRIAPTEVAFILPLTRARGALIAADRLAGVVRDVGQTELRVGIAEAGPGIERRELFRHAYCALLESGRSGSARVLAFSPEQMRSASAAGLTEVPELEPSDGSTGFPR